MECCLCFGDTSRCQANFEAMILSQHRTGLCCSAPALKNGSANFKALDTNGNGNVDGADDPYLPYYPGMWHLLGFYWAWKHLKSQRQNTHSQGKWQQILFWLKSCQIPSQACLWEAFHNWLSLTARSWLKWTTSDATKQRYDWALQAPNIPELKNACRSYQKPIIAASFIFSSQSLVTLLLWDDLQSRALWCTQMLKIL